MKSGIARCQLIRKSPSWTAPVSTLLIGSRQQRCSLQPWVIPRLSGMIWASHLTFGNCCIVCQCAPCLLGPDTFVLLEISVYKYHLGRPVQKKLSEWISNTAARGTERTVTVTSIWKLIYIGEYILEDIYWRSTLGALWDATKYDITRRLEELSVPLPACSSLSVPFEAQGQSKYRPTWTHRSLSHVYWIKERTVSPATIVKHSFSTVVLCCQKVIRRITFQKHQSLNLLLLLFLMENNCPCRVKFKDNKLEPCMALLTQWAELHSLPPNTTPCRADEMKAVFNETRKWHDWMNGAANSPVPNNWINSCWEKWTVNAHYRNTD